MCEAEFCCDEGQWLADRDQYERERGANGDSLVRSMQKRIENQREEIRRLYNRLREKYGEIERLQGALKAEERHNELTMGTAQKALSEKDAEIERLERICGLYALQYGTVVGKEVLLKQERADIVRKTIDAARKQAFIAGDQQYISIAELEEIIQA